ncbi:thiocillin family RiPP [Streptomyces erythrochromogenes]|uniref:Thiocillin family RiPP n=1 Tax=Streptomyces erythrochromogenes TaxID=285574 RepID=A0ABZ1QKX9_9ACTN|nr:thiocillin family RiPP [Streptomyces erythrochromogenes]MCX5588616.1 thiocillin family RiPP [Streptomyces erythrochromogenes]
MGETINLDLFAEDITSELTAEVLDNAALLGTWGSIGTFGSATCPASTASTGGSASSSG